MTYPQGIKLKDSSTSIQQKYTSLAARLEVSFMIKIYEKEKFSFI